MIYIQVNNNDVTMVHLKPFDNTLGLNKTNEELLQDGFFITELPNSENKFGKTPVLKGRKDLGTVWYEYVDRPLDTNEELQQLKDKTALMQQAIDDLILGGAL